MPMRTIEEVLGLAPVIPVLTIERIEWAVPLARALVAGGLRALEITLRTDVALDAVRAIAQSVPDAMPGVGTVTTPEDFSEARAAGAHFAVSPGFSSDLVTAAGNLPYLPGIATASEAMAAQRIGLRCLKFFPAEAMGGQNTLAALAGPFPSLIFCPTGGVRRNNAREYLSLANVRCVGGSWIAAEEDIASERWEKISKLASEVSSFDAYANP